MTCYGIHACMVCYGFGIKLTEKEKRDVYQHMLHYRSPFTISRKVDTIERCSACNGLGWVFKANKPGLWLPVHTWKRW